MNEQKILEVIIRAKDEASKVLTQVGKEAEGTKRVLMDYSKALTIVGGAVTAMSTASAIAIGNMAYSGGRLKDLEKSFQSLAKVAGITKEELLTQLQEATAGTISNADLIANSVKASMLGIPIEKMTGLFKIARQQSIAMGEDLGFMLESIVKGIGRASPLILDNLGITISLGDVYEKAAKKLNKKVDELTKEEQQQALTNAVLEWGAKKEIELGGAVTSNNDAYQRMTASITNLKNEMSKLYSTILAPFIDKLSEFVTKLNAINPDILKFAALFTIIATAVGLVLGPILLLVGLLPAIASGMALLGGAVGVAVAIFSGIVAVLAIIIGLIVAYKMNLFGFADAVNQVVANVQTWLMNAWKAIVDFFNQVVQWFMGIPAVVGDLLNQVVAFLADLLTKVGQTLMSIFEFIMNIPQMLLNLLVKFVFEDIPYAIGFLIGYLSVVIPKLISDFVAWWNALPQTITDIIDRMGIWVITKLLEVGFSIIDWTNKTKSDLVNGWKKIWEDAKAMWNNITTSIGQAVATAWTNISTEVSSWPKKIEDFLKDLPNILKKIFKDAGDAIIAELTSAWTKIQKIWDNIKKVFSDLINKAKEAGKAGSEAGKSSAGNKLFGGFVPETGTYRLHQGEYVVSNAMQSGRQTVDNRVTNAQKTINLNAVVNTPIDFDVVLNRMSWALNYGY